MTQYRTKDGIVEMPVLPLMWTAREHAYRPYGLRRDHSLTTIAWKSLRVCHSPLDNSPLRYE